MTIFWISLWVWFAGWVLGSAYRIQKEQASMEETPAIMLTMTLWPAWFPLMGMGHLLRRLAGLR